MHLSATDINGSGADAVSAHPLSLLEARLLSIGGTGVNDRNLDEECFAREIVTRGRLFDGLPVRMCRGRDHECHANAAAIWSAGDAAGATVGGYALGDCHLVRGYAMSADDVDAGVWYAHSWIVTDAKVLPAGRCPDGSPIAARTVPAALVETTVKFARYFGYVLTPDEALSSWRANYLERFHPVAVEQMARQDLRERLAERDERRRLRASKAIPVVPPPDLKVPPRLSGRRVVGTGPSG
jgi:hypothetical protein